MSGITLMTFMHKSHDLRKLAQPERLGLTTLKTGVGDYLEPALHSVINTENHRKVQLDIFSFNARKTLELQTLTHSHTSFTRRLRVWIELFY